jgi:hypothetical protein
MKEINKDIVKKHQIGCWDYVKTIRQPIKMYDRAVSNRRIDPSNGFGPLGAVVTFLRHKRQQNKSVVQLNMSSQTTLF